MEVLVVRQKCLHPYKREAGGATPRPGVAGRVIGEVYQKGYEMSEKDIIGLVIAGVFTLAAIVFLAVCAVAIYFEGIRPHLDEVRKSVRRITGIRLTVDREPEVKSDEYNAFRRQG